MIKLNIKIKVNKIEEIKSVIDGVKSLDLNKVPELNTEVTIEFGYDD